MGSRGRVLKRDDDSRLLGSCAKQGQGRNDGRETGQNSQISVRGNHVPAGLLPGRDPLFELLARAPPVS